MREPGHGASSTHEPPRSDRPPAESGHYQPQAELLHQSVQQLDAAGVTVDGAMKVKITGAEAGGRPTGKEWVADLHAGNPNVPAGELNMRWAQFAQTEGNEEQIRYKAGANAELLADPRSQAAGGQQPAAEGMGSVEAPPPTYI